LWQVVERWPCNAERLARLDQFCLELNRHKVAKNVHQAFELRHPSWFNDNLYEVLRKYDAAIVVNQSSKWPVVEVSTASWSYFRFHGPKELYASGYNDHDLKVWAEKAINLTPEKGAFYAYFNNDVYVDAPENAKTLRKYLP
jgi:uncharacterized protein YecE (DUF72 family)